jgi:(p)ppGpp synthase/HD superfamily hydrolase
MNLNLEKIFSAYDFAREAHDGQNRKTGEPYITHPVAVAGIYYRYHQDTDGLCASLLHDTVEDTDVTLSCIEHKFGETVALLVDGVTKEDSIQHTFAKVKAYSMKDSRVLLIKLSDRLHNVLTPFRIDETWKRRYHKSCMRYVRLARKISRPSCYYREVKMRVIPADNECIQLSLMFDIFNAIADKVEEASNAGLLK